MKLRAYEREDSPIIAKWVRTETELYQWSADRYGFFPLKDYSIDENYAPAIPTGRFIPLTMTGDDGTITGHLIIRYPKEDDDSSVRFGFVIVDPELFHQDRVICNRRTAFCFKINNAISI